MSSSTEVEATIFGIQSRQRGELVAGGRGDKVSILPENPNDNPMAKGTNFDVLDGRDVAPEATDDQNIVIFGANGMSLACDPNDPTAPLTMQPQTMVEDPQARYRAFEVVYDRAEKGWVEMRSVGHKDWWLKESGSQLTLVRDADKRPSDCTFWLRTVDAKIAKKEREEAARKIEPVWQPTLRPPMEVNFKIERDGSVTHRKPTGRGLFPARDLTNLPHGINGKPNALFEGGYAYKVVEEIDGHRQRIHIYNQTHDKFLKTEWEFGPLSEMTAVDGVADGHANDGYMKYSATAGPGEHAAVAEGYVNGYRCRASLDKEVDVSSSDDDHPGKTARNIVNLMGYRGN